jgi:hypothetical protein
MAYNSTATLDQLLGRGQDEVTFNGLANALSVAALFSVNQSRTGGLSLVINGGVMPLVGGVRAFVPTTTIALTASATNYIYASVGGVITKTTSPPAGWPALVGGAMALYQLTVGADAITSGTNYLPACGWPGGIGAVGAQGPVGAEIYLQRKRWIITQKSSEDDNGLDKTASFNVDAFNGLTTTTFADTVGGHSYITNNTTGASAQLYLNRNFWHRGNAAGRGGFDVSLRFGFESGYSSNATMRSLVGLYDMASAPIGNVEPDTLLNIVGVGARAGDANLSIMHNDGSGTATMSSLGANFPARGSIDVVYELRLQCAANASGIDWSILRADTGDIASGSVSSDIPANTQFLGAAYWVNTGTNTTRCAVRFMHLCGTSRY